MDDSSQGPLIARIDCFNRGFPGYLMELRSLSRRRLWATVLVTAVLILARLAPPARADDRAEIITVLNRYVKALYARDFRAVYEQLSSADQRLKDVHSYSRERGEFRDFTLEVAQALARSVEVNLIAQSVEPARATVKVKVNVPDASKLTASLLDWDSERLERLSAAERKTLLDTIDRQKRENSIAMVEGEETFNLVKETGGWKVFLDWAAGVKLNFQPAIPASAPVEIKIEQKEVASRPGQIFRVAMKIKNIGKQALSVRIGHLIEPQELRDYLDLVDCGFILPLRLSYGKEEEFVTTYLLRGTLPDQVRQLNVTYAVNAAPLESAKP
jgi:hypothetical protein